MNYNEAAEIMRKAGKPEKKLRYQTYLRKDGKDYVIRFWNTDIVRICPDGAYVLNSGGFFTATTKRRINTYSPAVILQRNYQWYVGGVEQLFYNGMVVDATGRIVEEGR